MTDDSGGPLAGLRVLEMGQLIAGPFCAQLLADFGAEVVKIEPPGTGDAMRQWGRTDAAGNPLWWPVIARGKKSLTLDLRRAEGQEIARALAGRADVLVENFRPGRLEGWGLGYAALARENPRLIMARVTGFGQTGPYRERAGFAAVAEAMAGMRHIAGFPDRPPVRVGLSLGDTLAGQSAFQGVLLALHHRERTGEGQLVDASITEAVLAVTESLLSEYDGGGHVRERSGTFLPGIAPSNAYPTADGDTIVIGANQDSLFRRLCASMGQPGLADDPRFRDHRARGRHQGEIDAIVADWTRTKPAAELVEALAEAGVPAGLTYRAKEILEDPHFRARESFVRLDDVRLGRALAMPNVAPRLSASPGRVRRTGPALGEHTEAVLGEWLGYDEGRVAALAEAGVL